MSNYVARLCKVVFYRGPRLKRVLTSGRISFPNSRLQVQHRGQAFSYHCSAANLSTAQPQPETDSHHIKNAEKVRGEATVHEFQAETRMLLDIVARSLYSDKEIFIRELISNSSDALQKVHYMQLSGVPLENESRPMEIHIETEKQGMIFTIQDTGVGMTKEEMISNLGTIARSGSRAFIEEMKQSATQGASSVEGSNSIIGQFGVGFYSCFMVSQKVEVFSKSTKPGSIGYKWTSDGSGPFEIQEVENVQTGTKIVLHLRPDCRKFSDEDTIKGIIKKYSSFVGYPIYLNGKQENTLEALWLSDPKTVDAEKHNEFYRFLSNASYGNPRFCLHFHTDSPLNIRCIIYFPEGKPGLFELSRDSDAGGLSLYSRKVLIKSKADELLPKWLRFVKGVVGSEDIPLNLSRELLQDSDLIRKLRTVLVNKVVNFLLDKSNKDTDSYNKFFQDYSLFLKEGILTATIQTEKEDIAKLLQFESSLKPEGTKVTLSDYCKRLTPGQKDIYYLCAPSRSLAESSPYFEALKSKNVEVLFCYEQYDELVLLQLRQFNSKTLTSIETEMREEKENTSLDDLDASSLTKSETQDLMGWLSDVLKGKAFTILVTKRLASHPCVITVKEMGAARHYVRTQMQQLPEETKYQLLQPQLEINPSHELMKKLNSLRKSEPKLAELLANQLFSNAMVTAGLIDDPRFVTVNMNELLALALGKH